MIIELFGPPAAGKTTLAHALFAALARTGMKANLSSSARPAEGLEHRACQADRWYEGSPVKAAFSRLVKVPSAVQVLLSNSDTTGVAARLMELLPPRTAMSRLRYRRYLSLLDERWTSAASSEQITIIDQAYMSAVSSLLLLGRPEHRVRVDAALALVPKADLIVCLDAPLDILDQRIAARLASQGPLERLFELSHDDNLSQRDIVIDLRQRLSAASAPTIEISSLDDMSLAAGVRRVVAEVEKIDRRRIGGEELESARPGSLRMTA